MCRESSITLTDGTAGGSWSSANTFASVNSTTGVVTGLWPGDAVIQYTIGSCTASKTVSVNMISQITQTAAATCIGTSVTLNDTTIGGSWISGSTPIATALTVGAGIGKVTGVSAGVATISYKMTASGCVVTTTVTVNSGPAPILGSAGVCQGSTTIWTNAVSGGIWSSSATGIATVNASTGVVGGVHAGTATISYTLGTSCSATRVVTVSLLPSAITGGSSPICNGSSVTLSDAALGGTWASGNTAVATINASGVVTALSPGTSTITYAVGGGCNATTTISINIAPVAISGPSNVCQGASITLTDGVAGGVWSSPTTFASVGAATGVVTGTFPGSATIRYSIGSCSVSKTVAVNAISPITGGSNVCTGATIVLNDATIGGSWSSSATGVASATTVGAGIGDVTGVSAGTAVISYVMTASGCTVTDTVTVSTVVSAISGAGIVCPGQTLTLTDAVSGGSWSTTGSAVATVDGVSGVVTGVSAGSAVITYAIGACTATAIVTVSPLPSAITGSSLVCTGSSTALSDATAGGTWSTSLTSVATVDGTGTVYGISSGSATITYTIGSGCMTTAFIIDNDPPSSITGGGVLCAGSSLSLSDPTGGGSWSTANSAVATLDGSGNIYGVSAGITTVTYLAGTGCYATTIVTINPLPAAITGASSVCTGSTITLSDTTGGGTWSSSISGIATVDASGNVTGVGSGSTTITYMLGSGCYVTSLILDNDAPSAITGDSMLCAGGIGFLFELAEGGTWSSSATSVATVDIAGTLFGVSSGTTTITYTSGSGCFATYPITINALPAPISGGTTVCTGSVIMLSDTTGGGTWSSSISGVATVDALRERNRCRIGLHNHHVYAWLRMLCHFIFN